MSIVAKDIPGNVSVGHECFVIHSATNEISQLLAIRMIDLLACERERNFLIKQPWGILLIERLVIPKTANERRAKSRNGIVLQPPQFMSWIRVHFWHHLRENERMSNDYHDS